MRWKGWELKTPSGRVVDHCMLCSALLHQGEKSVRFFGVYVHVPCYYREMGLPDLVANGESAAFLSPGYWDPVGPLLFLSSQGSRDESHDRQEKTLSLRLAEVEGRMRSMMLHGSGETRAPFARLDGVFILVVDDNEDARKICESMLRHAGATIRTVGSALAATRTLRHISPDVVLTDLSMPRHDGLWLVDWIRTHDARRGDHLPVIAITARDDLYDNATARRRGVDAYVRKPVPFRTLCATVATMVQPVSEQRRSA